MSESAHTNTQKHKQVIQSSWSRCRDFGLTQSTTPEIIQLSGCQWKARREEASELIVATEEQVLPYYENILVNSNSLVLLADSAGNLLNSWGRPSFLSKMEHHLFESGTSWQEQHNGTNAIGTALQTGQPVEVDRDEHFLSANRYMTASAAPIFDSSRSLVGVLNVSSDAYLPTSHVNGMVRVMSQAVENQLIIASYRHNCFLFVFNTSSDNIDSQWAGLLVFDESGSIIASNRRADLMVGHALRGKRIEEVTGLSTLQLTAHPERQVLPFTCMARFPLYAVIKRPLKPVARFSKAELSEAATKHERQPDIAKPRRSSLLTLDLGDAAVKRVIGQALSVVDSDIPVVIQGETGVGKEVFAQAFHASSKRSTGKMVAVNCAAIPSELVESELFGYVKGAFTGANSSGSLGYIRQANGGTLFLDEIGDMPLRVQARLLRVLQEKSVTPLGSTDSHPVDFRLLCATHQSLRAGMQQKTFREDLFYRVNGLTLFLPPLRERSDLLALVDRLLHELDANAGVGKITDEVRALFALHRWPGNIRQLKNVLHVALSLAMENRIASSHLPDDFLWDIPGCGQDNLEMSKIPVKNMSDWEQSLPDIYTSTGRNVSKTAQIMGVSRNTLYKRLKRLGMK